MSNARGDFTGRAVIVGGGVLGTMHAVMARQRGYAVTYLERKPEARGASVRNFGLIWVSGRRAGPKLTLARRARQLWEQISADVPGTGFRPAGSLTIATSDAELRVLEEAAKLPDAAERDFELLSPAAVREVNPGLRRELRRRAAVPRRRDRRAPAGAAGVARLPVPRPRVRMAARA